MIAKFFIERPVLANVLAILFVLIGAVALFELPVAQYPNVTPPTISVTTRYPGASAASQDKGGNVSLHRQMIPRRGCHHFSLPLKRWDVLRVDGQGVLSG